MSRETDSPSSGPERGRGGSAYPPGTEPYGAAGRGAGEAAEPGSGSEADTDEPRTETTITTRVRINIPGSRPIPPVVMRTPVGEEGAAPENGGRSGAGEDPARGAGGTTPSARRVTPSATPVTPASGPAGGGASPETRASDAPDPTGSGARTAASGEQAQEPGSEGEFTTPTSDWFAPRKQPRAAASGTGAAGTTGGAPAPGPSAGTPTTPPPGPGPTGSDGRGDLPYVTDPRPAEGAPPAFPGGPHPGDDARTATPPDGVPVVPSDPAGPPPFPPSGPTSGPAPGGMQPPPPTGLPSGPPTGVGNQPPGAFDGGASPFGPGPSTGLGQPAGMGRTPDTGRPTGTDQPPGPDGGPGAAAPGAGPRPGPVGEPPLAAPGGPDISDTLVGGMAPVPPADEDAAAPQGPPVPPPTFPAAEPEAESAAAAPAASPPASAGGGRKGRSKLVLAGAGVVALLGVAYGAGLLLDHADVPNGTTVLGVDIGGKSKHEAVNTLDKALGKRATAPLTLKVGDRVTKLKPSVAGLTLDNEATVRAAAGRDYNPVSVIGSLFGGTRSAEPAITVDAEKMESALSRVSSGGGGTPQDGMVRFVNGRAVAVKGKPYQGIDTTKAAETLEEAYRERAGGGANNTVSLPVSRQQPKIDDRELQRAVNGFGKTAMSGWLWLKAGDVEVPFSQETLGEFLTMRPGGDSLQPVIDPAALQRTYGNAFDNVVVKAGTGTVKMTPKHAAAVMIEALRKQAPAEPNKRVAVVQGASGG
ncbi:hypothetical protein E0L36_11065 [Streptomyces sp. AJS327]|uniref:hypothetical protein n=1 Tax=Streptomyces sp. AJS327 TaxID=2545265 RepID=UPI0015DE23B6|nr:hypothetical protein [Streptomyces sp. AJS327]MBA0051410.1 hypothetical protein [Streptomyces sp. AJS327]